MALMDNHNLFVQFLWPSRIPRDDQIQFSSKTKGNSQIGSLKFIRSIVNKVMMTVSTIIIS